jgi:hypothetical protein
MLGELDVKYLRKWHWDRCFSLFFTFLLVRIVDRDSSVGIATRYGMDGPGNQNPVGAINPSPVQTGPAAHPASYTMGIGSFPGVKRPGRGCNYPPHLAPSLKKAYIYTPPPLGLCDLL